MSETCPNCARPVLPADTVCWHCGYQLPPRAKSPPRAHQRGRSGDGASDAEPVDLRDIAVYGLLTLVVILALLAVMRSLGRQPVLVRSAGVQLGGEWVTVTDADLRYTISLPSDWQWFDLGWREQDELLDGLVERQPFIRWATRPLGEAAGDVTILAVAAAATEQGADQPQPLLVVGRSERLREVTPEEAFDLLAARSSPTSEQSIDTRLSGQRQARFETVDEAYRYQCRHLFVADEVTAAYLVAACAPMARFGTVDNTLDDILNSFQLLQH